MSETINRVPTCAAHPGEPATGACGSCLRDARERAEALEATLAHMRGELADDREARRLLARQCDLAREAEAERDAARREAAEALAREAKLRRALAALVHACEDAFDSPAEAESWAQKGDMQGYLADANAALALPADRAALDAALADATEVSYRSMEAAVDCALQTEAVDPPEGRTLHQAVADKVRGALAQARAEGAQACVEAARRQAAREEPGHMVGADGVLAAVERAAREAGAKEPTP